MIFLNEEQAKLVRDVANGAVPPDELKAVSHALMEQTGLWGEKMVDATVHITFAVVDHREDAELDAANLLREMIVPHVHSVTDWDNRFIIVTHYEHDLRERT